MLSVPMGVPPEAVEALLRKGKAQRYLTQDDVLAVFKTEAALETFIEVYSERLAAEGIVLEDQPDDDLTDDDALATPLPAAPTTPAASAAPTAPAPTTDAPPTGAPAATPADAPPEAP